MSWCEFNSRCAKAQEFRDIMFSTKDEIERKLVHIKYYDLCESNYESCPLCKEEVKN